MRTVVLSFYEAYPPVSGGATVTYNMAKYLSGQKWLIQMGKRRKDFSLEKELSVITVPNLSNKNLLKLFNVLVRMFSIAARIRKLDPDVVLLEGSAWSMYYVFLLFVLNIRGVRSRIVYHSHNVDYLLRRDKNYAFIAFLTRWAEGKLVRKVDLITAVSHEDAQEFHRIYKVRPYILPNGVDVDRFENISEGSQKKISRKYGVTDKTILFMGLTNYKPNKEALDFLIHEVFPVLVEKSPETKLAVIGGDIDVQREWLVNPGVIPFEEVPVFIRSCAVCVAPIFSGSGTRLKILEYLAAARPVVATSKGAEGLGLEDGKDILIAENTESFVKMILALLNGKELSSEIGKQGQHLVRKTYAWKVVLENFCEELSRLELRRSS